MGGSSPPVRQGKQAQLVDCYKTYRETQSITPTSDDMKCNLCYGDGSLIGKAPHCECERCGFESRPSPQIDWYVQFCFS